MPADMQPTLNNDPATRANNYTLRRREVIARILADRPKDLLIVVGLGTPSFDIVAAGDTGRSGCPEQSEAAGHRGGAAGGLR